jgi:phosphopantetheinyl transferase
VPFEGKEEEALLKYKGQRTTAKMVQVDSVEECKKLAIAECHIDRVLLIKQKSVNAMFHLKNIDEGVDLCK